MVLLAWALLADFFLRADFVLLAAEAFFAVAAGGFFLEVRVDAAFFLATALVRPPDAPPVFLAAVFFFAVGFFAFVFLAVAFLANVGSWPGGHREFDRRTGFSVEPRIVSHTRPARKSMPETGLQQLPRVIIPQRRSRLIPVKLPQPTRKPKQK
ncbi:MAG: hypothetical protein AAGH92_02320 [Planctomycetota bacterium]